MEGFVNSIVRHGDKVSYVVFLLDIFLISLYMPHVFRTIVH